MESRLNTDTDHQRIKNTRWFNRDALKIMDRYDSETGAGQVVVAGTIVHPESRLNRLKKNVEMELKANIKPIWKMQFYKAADDPETLANPLWPERFDEKWLNNEKRTAIANDDLGGFLQEFFNDPVVSSDRKFKPSYFSKRYDNVTIEAYYGSLTLVINNQRYPVRLSAGLDIGGWEDRGSDYTAIVIGCSVFDHINNVNQGYVLEAYNERLDPTEIIELMFDISHNFAFKDQYGHEFYRMPWTVETNAFQTMLYHFINVEMRKKDDYSVNIAYEEHESTNKKGRILSLVPVFKAGFYVWPNHLDWLVQRFINYGLASDIHDDVEDAFQKMHRNLSNPYREDYSKLQQIKPRYIKPVEPAKLEDSWVTV